MLPLGTKIPYFRFEDVVSGKPVSSDSSPNKKALLVMFICNHCPYVKHVQGEIAQVAKDYADKPLGVVAISSNDVKQYPDDSPENLKKQAQELGFNFPYLYDETQNVAKAFTAACTPDFFLFNEKRELTYRGQLDDSRPGNDVPVTGKDLRKAIDRVLVGKRVTKSQKPSSGCNIKWKIGNEPSYF
jgi:thiol-disulfide isomerase/thioredoxin